MALRWNMLRVRDKKELYEELLMDIDTNSFIYSWNRDLQRSISFTVQRTQWNAFSFDLLEQEGFVKFRNELYVIKQCTPRSSGTVYEKAITANHVGFAVQDHVKNDTEENVTMNLKQYLEFYLKGNKLGYTYEIKGNFKKSNTWAEVGGKNALTGITEGKDVYGYIPFCENRHWIFYDKQTYYMESNNELRYLYNTDDVSVSVDTTELKTAVRVYGKKKETETLEYSKQVVNKMTLTGTFLKSNTWYTDDVGASATGTIKVEKNNDKLYINQRVGEYGGLMKIYINGVLESTVSCYSKKPRTKKWLVSDNLKKGTYTIKLVFVGMDNENVVTKRKPRMYLGASGANIFIVTSQDAYYGVLDYISPNAAEWGEKWAEPIHNEELETEAELKEFAMKSLQDYPILSLSVTYQGDKESIEDSYKDVPEYPERETWLLYHEVLGLNAVMKPVELRAYHPFTKRPQEMTFSNAQKDVLTMQKQIINNVKNIDRRTASINSQLLGINDKVGSTGIITEKV